MCSCVCAGKSRADSVRAEFYRGRSSPADCSSWLSQPAHGESLCVLLNKLVVVESPAWCLSSPRLEGLRPSVDRALLWRGGGSHLPGSLLLRHCSDVLLNRVQCAAYLAEEEVSHTHSRGCCRARFPLHSVAQLSYPNRRPMFRINSCVVVILASSELVTYAAHTLESFVFCFYQRHKVSSGKQLIPATLRRF